jgi:hypothetical protein
VAIEQLDRYHVRRSARGDFFVPNLVRVVSDGMLTRVGSITSDRSRFMPWRPLADDGGKRANAGGADPWALRAAGAAGLSTHVASSSRRTRAARSQRRSPGITSSAPMRKARAGVLVASQAGR